MTGVGVFFLKKGVRKNYAYSVIWNGFLITLSRNAKSSLMRKILLTLFAVTTLSVGFAQNVGIGTNTPENTAILDLKSDSMGFLAPRLTTAQRDAIVSPAHGLTIFNVQDSTIQYWNGQCWLRSYQVDCSDCIIDMNLSADSDTIDRVISDSVQVAISITQQNGLPTLIPLTVANTLPQGMTFTINPNPMNGPGTSVLTVHASPIVPAGVYPIIIQSFCGSFVQTLVYNVTVEPCYILNINNSVINYNMGTDLYNTYPNAPTNQPVCVLTVVATGVEVSSNTTSQPAFTTGNIPAGSLVAILNNGNILGKGGNGGTAYNPPQNATGAGFNGGNAIELTLPCTIQNNFNIYGGGGGGNAMAFGYTYSVPVIGNLGLLVGSGGGGGAGGQLTGGVGGLGGNFNGGSIGIFEYNPGFNGTPGQFGIGGNGGLINYPISYTVSLVTVTLNPNSSGGKGGDYGFPGTQGVFQLSGSITVNIPIPIIGGSIPLTVFNGNFPIPVPPPPAGLAGFAIKRNGNACNVPDNNYSTSNLKGLVAP